MTHPGSTPERPFREIILLVGAVGAGKGTQAGILSRELGLPHVASGNLFREALRDGTPLGEEAREYMQRGELVPDELTIAMVMERLARPDARGGVILDGFPRTVRQAEALDETLAAQGERIDARADQYSLAALAYLLLTGRPPHRHATLAAAANPGEPEPMSTAEWPIPRAVEDVVRRRVGGNAPIERVVLRVALGQPPCDFGLGEFGAEIEGMRPVVLDAKLREQI